MEKVESLMGKGMLQSAKTGLFGGGKSFEVRYQFQLVTEEAGQAGQLEGFVRVDEKQKISAGASYLVVLDDNRKGKLTVGKAVSSAGGIVTYSANGETVD